MLSGIYADESGNNGFGDISNQPILCYAGVLVPFDKQIHVNDELEKIKNGVLTKIINKIQGVPRKEIKTISFFKTFEIHSRDFFEGESFYSQLTFQERLQVMQDILDLVKNNSIDVAISVINKQSYKNDTGDKKHHKMHERGYNEFLKIINNTLNVRDNHYGFMVADECREDESTMFSTALNNQGVPALIYPDLQIRSSHSCNIVQLADLIAFLTANFYRNQYGFRPRKNHNQHALNLYSTYLSNHVKIWEYK